MKITIKKTIEETHELELPAYRKNICFYYKIVNEEQAVSICFAEGREAIAMSYTSIALKCDDICTQEEFEVNLSEVINILKTKASV
jgi:hypothetical protein